MFCRNCGEEIPEGSSFCEHCGAPVEADTDQTERMDQTELAAGIPFRTEEDQFFVKTDQEPELFEEYIIDPNQKSPGRPRWLLPVLFIGLAVISIAAGMFVAILTGDDSDNEGSDQPTTAAVEEDADEEEDADADDGGQLELTYAQARVFAGAGIDGNTYGSFDRAISQGAMCIEQDVVMSTDGTLFTSHNRDYNYLPDSAAVSDGLPRLEDIFQKYGKTIIYVVEIKAEDTAAAEELIRLIYDYDLEENVIIQSFYPVILKRVKSEFPEMTSIIIHDNGAMNRVSFDEALGLDYADMVAVNIAEGKMTAANCNAAHDAGKEFVAWSLDSEDQIRRGIEMGLDAYFTRIPGTALELEGEYD